MKKLLFILFIVTAINSYGQYTKEKLRDLLCGTNQKSWQAQGINIDRPEKTMTFALNNTAEIENQKGVKQPVKWSLQTSDNIRWFISIGAINYELIVSYNKKGEQYIKLTHRPPGDQYEIRLNEIK